MSMRRLRARVPSARKVAVATLPGYQLLFHKKSERDGSAKCDASETGISTDVVYGVLFDIQTSEKILLDCAEGLGVGYAERMIRLYTKNKPAPLALAYVAISIDPTLKPFHWYKEHVVRGAVENRLPKNYLEMIQCIESIPDPNSQRSARELRIYL